MEQNLKAKRHLFSDRGSIQFFLALINFFSSTFLLRMMLAQTKQQLKFLCKRSILSTWSSWWDKYAHWIGLKSHLYWEVSYGNINTCFHVYSFFPLNNYLQLLCLICAGETAYMQTFKTKWVLTDTSVPIHLTHCTILWRKLCTEEADTCQLVTHWKRCIMCSVVVDPLNFIYGCTIIL
jgi:hypothetical protein